MAKETILRNPQFEVEINGKWYPVIQINYETSEATVGYYQRDSGTWRMLNLKGGYDEGVMSSKCYGYSLKDRKLRMVKGTIG